MTLWSFADAHPVAFTVCFVVLVVCTMALLHGVLVARKPPTGGAS